MKDFWLSSGHHLVDRGEGGGLMVTDELLKAYLARPELSPPPDACVVERTLHGALLAEPRRPVFAGEIAAVADADARENWQMMIAFRDHLLKQPTLEAAYISLARGEVQNIPPLFMNQLAQLVLRNALDDCEDPFVLRAAELFFRPQRVAVHDGSLIAADQEVFGDNPDMHTSPLVAMIGLPAKGEIDVMVEDNADQYWDRSDRFDFAFDLTGKRRGQAALGEAIARFVRHLMAVDVEVEPIVEARDVKLTWYVGLDTEGTRIGNALWNGEEIDEATGARVVSLFKLTFRDTAPVIDKVKGEPVYLIMATAADRVLRMKPQNLVTGLPVRHMDTVS